MIQKVVDVSSKSKEEILAKMTERKKKTHGLLSDYGALYAVAKEFGVDLNEDKTQLTKIGDIEPQKAADLCGTVKLVYSPREFKRKDNTTGKFASMILLDDTGEIRMVLWDQNTEITQKVRVGDVLLVKNGYVKDNNGVVEVHAGPLTNLTINPSLDIKLPGVEERLLKITELEKGNPSVNTILRVTHYYPQQTFQRNDGTTGARSSFIGEDETGKIRVVLWDKATDVSLKDGDIIHIANAYTKEGLSGGVELQAGSRSRILETDAKLNLAPLETGTKELHVSAVKPNMAGISIAGRVLRVYPPRAYSNGMMASLMLGDASGVIRVVLWDEKSKSAEELKEGDAVLLQNVYTKANMNNEAEVHVGKYGTVTVDNKADVPSLKDIEERLTVEKKIVDLDVTDSRVRVKAKVVDIGERPPIYMTCPSCGKKAQNLSGVWFCDNCGDIDPDANLVVSAVLEDETGTTRAVFFGNTAEKILGVDVEGAMNLIGETQDELAPLTKAKEKMLNKEVLFIGRVKYNDFSDQLELIVDEVI